MDNHKPESEMDNPKPESESFITSKTAVDKWPVISVGDEVVVGDMLFVIQRLNASSVVIRPQVDGMRAKDAMAVLRKKAADG